VALGFSLGGNVLLKWLGENPKQSFFRSAMAVSVPLKLDECASAIDSGFSKLYQKHLIRSLVKKTACKLNGNFPGPLLEASTLAEDLSNFWQFDEKVTAPLHGFRSAKDYYELSSSYHFLPRIETPTLVLQAIDDPFLNADMIPDKSHLGSGVTVEVSEKGGHVGFMESINDRTQSCFLAKKVMHYFGAD